MLTVAHNLQAMNSQRQFNIVNRTQAKSTEKLSSGYKINRAADDAAGLAISEKMRRQIRGLSQAALNCQDGVSLVQIADGALAEVHDMLDRCSELSIKAATATLTDSDRDYIQMEIAQIKNEIDGISDRTTFNEIQILKGKDAATVPSSGGAVTLGGLPSWVNGGASLAGGKLSDAVTTGSGDTRLGMVLDFSALDADPSKIADLKAENSGFYTTCCTCSAHYSIKFVDGTAKGPQKSGNHNIYEVSLDGVNNSTDLVNKIVSAVGSNPNGHYTNFEADGGKLIVYENRPEYDPSQASPSHPSSGNGLAGPGVAYAEEQVPLVTPVDIFIQADAEPNRHIDIQLPAISCKALRIHNIDVSTISGADKGIAAFKKAKEYVSGERSRMGAYQNRLEHTINNLENVVENTTAAESQIRDTDMSLEMVRFANNNILLQAGQAMMSQANQSNQGVLSLLS